MKNGNFLAKNFNESFHRNIWNAVLTSLLKVLTTETETLGLNVRRSKKMFSKTLSPKCSPRLVEHNFDTLLNCFCLEENHFRSTSEIEKRYNFLKGWNFPQKLHWTRKKAVLRNVSELIHQHVNIFSFNTPSRRSYFEFFHRSIFP